MKKSIAIFHSMKLKENFMIGGVQKVCVNLVKGFQDKGWDSFLVQHRENSAISKFLEHNNLREQKCLFEIPTLKNDYGGISLYKFLVSSISIVLSILKMRKDTLYYDVVILNDITSIFFNKAFEAKKKYLFLHTERFSRSIFARLAIAIWPTKDLVIICPTKQLLKIAKIFFPQNSSIVLPTPVFSDSDQPVKIRNHQFGANKSKLKLCYIGRISPNKNIKPMIKMAMQLSEYKKINLDIYGEPFVDEQREYFQDLKSFCESKNLGSSNIKIKFCGLTKEPIKTFSRYDFSVILSDGEAIPLAGLESLRAQTPVIAWDAAGVSELVIDGVTGIIVQKKIGSEEVLVNQELIRIIDNYKFDHAKVGEIIDKYTVENFVKNIEELSK